MTRVVWRLAARRDVADAAHWYASQANLATGERFLDAVEQALSHLSLHPGSGSPRYALALQLEGLRVWPVHGFPYLVFYIEQPSQLDVWRVLHAQRDIPAWMLDTP